MTYQLMKLQMIPKPAQQCIGRVAEPVEPCIEANESLHPTSRFIGRKFSCGCGDFVVIDTEGYSRESMFTIQFVQTGFIKHGVRRSHILDGVVKDPYYPSRAGVACLGTVGVHHPLHSVWSALINRCYNQDCGGYGDYGGRGVWVCDRWLVLSNFAEDATKLPRWDMKLKYPKEYSLDKDILGSNCYSPDTCVWSSTHEQTTNRRGSPLLEAVNESSGECVRFINASRFLRAINHSGGYTTAYLAEKGLSRSGWKFEVIHPPEGYVYRYLEHDLSAFSSKSD